MRTAACLAVALAVAWADAAAVGSRRFAAPLDASIPQEQYLIDQGLSSVPVPGQPASPVVVDRVVDDGATTYVQYHVPQASVQGGSGPQPFLVSPAPLLTVRVGNIRLHPTVSFGSPPQALLPFPLPAWFPWQPPTLSRYVFEFTPLPLGAPTAVLTFTLQGKQETVTVPLDLSALGRVSPSSSPLVGGPALRARLIAVHRTTIVVDYVPHTMSEAESLTDAHGHTIALSMGWNSCYVGSAAPGAALNPCREVWTFPPQPRGAHLTLMVRRTDVYGPRPLLFPVVIP